jgi:hypothetical protein
MRSINQAGPAEAFSGTVDDPNRVPFAADAHFNASFN